MRIKVGTEVKNEPTPRKGNQLKKIVAQNFTEFLTIQAIVIVAFGVGLLF